MNTEDKVLEACSDYVYKKEASLIASENKLVWYASLTGRKQDFQWHSLSLTEAVRAIRATRLSGEAANMIGINHLTQACQELGCVYEYAVKSVHAVVDDTVFNYHQMCDSPVEEMVCNALAAELATSNYTAMLHKEVTEVYNRILGKLKTSATMNEQRAYFQKCFPAHGYEMRMDAQRPQFEGRKQSAIMLPSARPSHIAHIDEATMVAIIAKVKGQVE